jgi:hypothetical protein
MSEPADLQIEMLKPHVRAIFDEARRVGLDGCRAARYEVEARFQAAPKAVTFDKGSPDCAGLHVLAAVAMDIYLDQSGQEGAIIALIDAIIAQGAADDCEAAAAAATQEPG